MAMLSNECSRFRTLSALNVGGDLDERQSRELRLHLDVCPGCARTADEFAVSHTALRSIANVRPEFESAVWPQLRREITRQRSALHRQPATPAWLSISAVAAAVVALVTIYEEPRPLSNTADPSAATFHSISRNVGNDVTPLFPEASAPSSFAGSGDGTSRELDRLELERLRLKVMETWLRQNGVAPASPPAE